MGDCARPNQWVKSLDMPAPIPPSPSVNESGADSFSIGDAAAIVGVSTHVLRSWERRLSLGLNHRTRSNQRRYRLQDIQRFIAIRQLHETGGLPLVESAARALEASRENDEPAHVGGAMIGGYWAGLIDTVPEIVLVIDGAGRITVANEIARTSLNVDQRASFLRLAPAGWRRTYQTIRHTHGRRQRILLAMRGRSTTMMLEAHVEPIGTRPDGPMVVVGRPVSESVEAQLMAGRGGA